ncbi:MAG: bifunctional phosphoribosyl-AMP cyclohydrolase/phosphoribosyl-ATP diphosphatase HisIE [Candidatus Eremiobacteraeota bacterium]|nr:bifunctional phosphoribosyl-AMP cyclohydrolase/phosphoribosyl-ATP diphosphatase HisIE [Candidatus Eremiobacteraeota bacterium]
MNLDKLKWGSDGLLPVVIADATTGAVLTLAWADRAALERTIATRETHLYSRSRQAPWRKGESSGNTQRVREVNADCDGDALLYSVEPAGPACHTGEPTCFHESLLMSDVPVRDERFAHAMNALEAVLVQRKIDPPEGSYVAKLYAGGVDRIGKKIGEEATEVVIAAKNDDPDELVWESADLLFHLLVMLAERNVSLGRVGEHLLQRVKPDPD